MHACRGGRPGCLTGPGRLRLQIPLPESGGCEHIQAGEAQFSIGLCRACYNAYIALSGGHQLRARDPVAFSAARNIAGLLVSLDASSSAPAPSCLTRKATCRPPPRRIRLHHSHALFADSPGGARARQGRGGRRERPRGPRGDGPSDWGDGTGVAGEEWERGLERGEPCGDGLAPIRARGRPGRGCGCGVARAGRASLWVAKPRTFAVKRPGQALRDGAAAGGAAGGCRGGGGASPRPAHRGGAGVGAPVAAAGGGGGPGRRCGERRGWRGGRA